MLQPFSLLWDPYQVHLFTILVSLRNTPISLSQVKRCTLFFSNFSTKYFFERIFLKKNISIVDIAFCKIKFVILPKGRSVKGRGANTTKTWKSVFS
jgi:hypothetical protein